LACCTRLVRGVLVDVTAAVKHAIRALATRSRELAAEIAKHDAALDALTAATVPTLLRAALGNSRNTAAKMLIVAGDNPSRIRSEAAFAKLVGACPIPASSGMNTRHQLFRGGHRQAKRRARYGIVLVRIQWHQPTQDYLARRTRDGRSKKEIIRCLKRYVDREVFAAALREHAAQQPLRTAA
jgi:transposase